ncbi:extracellular solute-binding protein [Acidisphaera sp. L21]|uniref:extracellular solute-binding protein n=1 Tax=Acidisphaera sp. L21 TaxID=1641851 RepID=UPI00131ECBE2|nr:extracellular solute-binding protein [Acidisphaera sp. L21]
MALIGRRTVLAGAAVGLAGGAMAQTAKPKSPLAISIVDVGGALALTQKAFEAYRKAKPEMVSRFVFTKAPAPELPGKLKAQQDAKRLDIDMVLGGTDIMSSGIAQGIWTELFPAHAASLPNLKDILLEPAWQMQQLTKGQGCVVVYYPSGPLLEYAPDRVPTPPTTAAGLLDWVKAHPNRFMYARPANSGPGRTFIMGLPYLLGDSNPKDPQKGWDKTWAFLQEMDHGIEYYPTGTAAVMKELGDGSRDMIVSTTGWDINPRVLGIVPKEVKVQALQGFHWVVDAQYMYVPKGVSDERMAVLLDLMSFMLQKPQQAVAYDEGYFYPGPAVKDVPLSMAPEESQKAIAEYGRPEYAQWIDSAPKEIPLDPDAIVYAFRRWDEQIGSRKTK